MKLLRNKEIYEYKLFQISILPIISHCLNFDWDTDYKSVFLSNYKQTVYINVTIDIICFILYLFYFFSTKERIII